MIPQYLGYGSIGFFSNASTCFTENGFGTFRMVALAPLAGILLLLIHLEYPWFQSVCSLWTPGHPQLSWACWPVTNSKGIDSRGPYYC